MIVVATQKTLMAKWRRRTLGFAFDPEPDMDIQWEEERSSGDYDSEDEHSSVEGDSSEDELTTEGEDDLEEAETVEVEGQAGKTDLQVSVRVMHWKVLFLKQIRRLSSRTRGTCPQAKTRTFSNVKVNRWKRWRREGLRQMIPVRKTSVIGTCHVA